MRDAVKPERKTVKCYFCYGPVVRGIAHQKCMDENFEYIIGRLDKTEVAILRYRYGEISALFRSVGVHYGVNLIKDLAKMDWTEDDLISYAKTYGAIQKASA